MALEKYQTLLSNRHSGRTQANGILSPRLPKKHGGEQNDNRGVGDAKKAKGRTNDLGYWRELTITLQN